MEKKFKVKNRMFKSNKATFWFRFCVSFMIIFLLTSLVSFMFSIGTTDMLEYAASFNKVETRDTVIERDATGYYSIKTAVSDSEPIKILQLTDIHIGNGVFTTISDRYAMDAIYKVVEFTKPDLIICTGDSAYPVFIQTGTSNNLNEARVFGTLMESIGVPWAFAYGNHDSEVYGTHKKSAITKYYESLSYENGGSCLFTAEQTMLEFDNNAEFGMDGEYFGDVFGESNYFVNVLNFDGSLNTMCVLLDSNMYVDGSLTDGYDNIHEDQIEWYEAELNRVSKSYGYPDGALATSLAFYHIPNQEYYKVWDALEKDAEMLTDEWGTYFASGTKVKIGEDDVVYNFGYMGEGYRENGEAIISVPRYDDLFFEKAVELGSTKGIFVGHDHKNTFSITYRGINLNFGLSIDNLAYVKQTDTAYRGGTVIELDDYSAGGEWSMVIAQDKYSEMV